MIVCRALVYLRRSRAGDGGGLETQRGACVAFCAGRGWDVAGEYVDDGVSGVREARPGLDALRAAVRSGGGGLVVVVFRLDRLARSVRQAVVLLDEFRAAGCEFASATEGLDTSGAVGRALFAIVAALAELEREGIRERIVAGQARAVAAGVRVGRPVRLGAGEVARALDLRASGRTWREVARMLCAPSRTVRRAVARETARASGS